MAANTYDYDPLMDELPPELAAQYKAEQRRKQMAEAMLSQSMQPLQAPEVKGRFQAAISPFEGIAKIAQAYLANKNLQGTDKALADIGQQRAAGMSDAMKRMTQAMAGTPAVPESTIPMPVGGNPDERAGDMFQVGTPAAPGSIDAAVQVGMQSPYTRKIAEAMLMEKMKSAPQMAFKAEESKLMREQRMRELEMRLEDQRLSREQRDTLQRDLMQMRTDAAREMKQMVGAMSTPKQGLAYLDDNGQAIWGTILEAKGKPAANYSPGLQGNLAGAKEAGKGAGEMNIEQFKMAEAAKENLDKINQLITHIDKSNAITGMGADMFKNIERAKALMGNKVAAGKVADTEILDVMMGSEVFPMIKSLGIGARGMDTPAEREFMRKVLTGEISLNKATLKRMAETRRDIAQRAIDKWNTRVDKGELDNFFKSTGIPKGTVGGSPAAAGVRVVDW